MTTIVSVGELIRIFQWQDIDDNQPWHINDHCFVRGDNQEWHMYGIVWPDPGGGVPDSITLGHAIAPDLYGPWTAAQPALICDADAGETVLWAPHVVRVDGGYFMAYASGGPDPALWGISGATSNDLHHWTRMQQPLFRDGYQARDPMLFRLQEKELWVLYYCATEPAAGGNHVVACRTSSDLQNWSDRRVVFTDSHVGTEYGPTESPFVVQHGAEFLLFIGPRPYEIPTDELPNWRHPGYDGTDVFSSSRWDEWKSTDLIAHLPLHAPEVIKTKDGYRISHCGIARNGLWLAKLTIDV